MRTWERVLGRGVADKRRGTEERRACGGDSDSDSDGDVDGDAGRRELEERRGLLACRRAAGDRQASSGCAEADIGASGRDGGLVVRVHGGRRPGRRA